MILFCQNVFGIKIQFFLQTYGEMRDEAAANVGLQENQGNGNSDRQAAHSHSRLIL